MLIEETTTEATITTRFADWVYNLELTRTPPETVRQARRALLDTVGVICAGAKHDVVTKTRSGFGLEEKRPCSVTGGGARSAGTAALINGVAAHAFDFDDASYTGIMHGSAVIVPAVLAVMEEIDATDTQALEAIVTGSEIAYVLADTLTHRHYFRGWWSSATLSTVGAAAASAKLYGLAPAGIAHAIALAAANAGGSRTVLGSDAKPFLCGHVAKTAVAFAAAARAGVAGPLNVFEGENGFFSLVNEGFWDPAPLDTLGSSWRLVEPGLLFKRYPICSAAQAVTEESADLKAKAGFAIESLREVSCHVPTLVAKSLIYDDPQTPQQAQFSIPFGVACGLHFGGIGLEHLSPDVLFDSEVRATMSKVQSYEDANLSTDEMRAKYPESARVEIRLEDDSSVEGTRLLATGMPARPLSDEDLAGKFRACIEYANPGVRDVDEAVNILMQSGSEPSQRRIKGVLSALWAAA